MLLGVVSDTHGNVRNARAAAHLLASLEVGAVLHCGDVGTTDVPPVFAPWPTHYVVGNCDEGYELELQNAALAAGGTWHGLQAELELAGRRIAVTHGHERKLLYRLATCGEYDLVCSGHTHIAAERREGRTLVLNPGALHRASPYTIAVVNLADLTAESFTV